MKFPYLKQPSAINPSAPWISRPVVPVRLEYKAVSLEVLALLDSGADISLFNATVAEELLIDITSGDHQEFFGISGHTIDVYYHSIGIQLVGSSESITVTVGFTTSRFTRAVLGQADFFMYHQVKFERYKERMEITPSWGKER